MRKRHNQLINRLTEALLWRKIVEYKFDALVRNWKDGRHLLIEAKTASEGTAGRSQKASCEHRRIYLLMNTRNAPHIPTEVNFEIERALY